MSKAIKIERTKDGLSIIRLPKIVVNWDIEWEERIRRGAPRTEIWYHPLDEKRPLVSDPVGGNARVRYPRTGNAKSKTGIERTAISLLSFNKEWEWRDARNYVADKKLSAALSEHVLAIGESLPSLRYDLKKNALGILSLTEMTFERTEQLESMGDWFHRRKKWAMLRSRSYDPAEEYQKSRTEPLLFYLGYSRDPNQAIGFPFAPLALTITSAYVMKLKARLDRDSWFAVLGLVD